MRKTAATVAASMGLMFYASQVLPQAEIHVATIDSGVSANVNIAPGGFNFFSNNANTSDTTSSQHGSTSARVIDQMAPGIPIVPMKVTGLELGDVSQSATDAALLSAAGNPNIRVIGISAGSPGVSATVADAASANKTITIFAGNFGDSNPNTLSVASAGLPGVMIVGATNDFGIPLSITNGAGVTAERYVMTSGVTEFSNLAGTSFASARMAGIAAEVLRATPFLTAEELAQVIFATAEDLGEPGVDTASGHGFVRDAAQVINNPAGNPIIPGGEDSGGGGAAVAAGALVLGGAAAAAIVSKNKKKLKKTLVLDSFGRPFYIDLTEAAGVNDDRPHIAQFLEALDERFDAHRLALSNNLNLDVYYTTVDTKAFDPARHFALADDPAFDYQYLDMSFSLAGGIRDGVRYSVNTNTNPGYYFGAVDNLFDDSRGSVSFLSGQTFSTPLLGFAHKADSAILGLQPSERLGVKFGLVDTHESEDYGSNSVAAFLEGEYEFNERAMLSAQIGRLNEAGSLFGGSSGGAFGVDSTSTYAMSLSGSYRLSDRIALIGNYGVGYSIIDDADKGLLRNFSSLRSNWFGLGVIANSVVGNRDQLGFAFSQPLRVDGGHADIRVPYARDFDGNIYRDIDRINLTPDGRELTVEAYYRFGLTKHATAGAYVMLQHEPNHFADSGNGVTVLATLKYRL